LRVLVYLRLKKSGLGAAKSLNSMNRGESLISLAMDDRKQIGIKVIHNSILCIDYKYLILYYRLKINLSLFYLILFLTLAFLIDVFKLESDTRSKSEDKRILVCTNGIVAPI
jgi:hypothetical protein